MARHTSHLFPEGPGEVAHVLKAAQDRDLRDFVLCFQQKPGGPLDAVLLQVLDGGGADGAAEAAQAFAFTDGGTGGDPVRIQIAAEMVVDKCKHGLDPCAVPQPFAAGGGDCFGDMAVEQGGEPGQGIPDFENISAVFPYTVLPGAFQGLQRLFLPGNIGAQGKEFQAKSVQQRLHIALVEDTVQTAPYQPGMEHERVEHAPRVLRVPAAVKDAGIDEEAFSGVEGDFLVSRSDDAASMGDDDGFPFLVPVPGNVHFAEIVLVAGDGKGSGAVGDQLPATLVNGGVAF